MNVGFNKYLAGQIEEDQANANSSVEKPETQGTHFQTSSCPRASVKYLLLTNIASCE